MPIVRSFSNGTHDGWFVADRGVDSDQWSESLVEIELPEATVLPVRVGSDARRQDLRRAGVVLNGLLTKSEPKLESGSLSTSEAECGSHGMRIS